MLNMIADQTNLWKPIMKESKFSYPLVCPILFFSSLSISLSFSLFRLQTM
jgi:hypothetical protein